MTLRKKGTYWYGDDEADLRAEIRRFSELNGYAADHFAEAVCSCGTATFHLYLDEQAGVAVRVCSGCEAEHPVGDSSEYITDAELEKSTCVCEMEVFEISVGVSLYAESNDVRWLYVGGRCASCGIVGVYGDWKNEHLGYAELLRRI